MTSRPSWDEYFMSMAHHVATRATCDRKHVGAVLVSGSWIIATGYNGSISGQPHCDDAGHLLEGGHCVRTVHAEVNALTQAARSGRTTEGARCYVTAFPCWRCYQQLANAGVTRIHYDEPYRVSPHVEAACASHVDGCITV